MRAVFFFFFLEIANFITVTALVLGNPSLMEETQFPY